VNSSEIQAFGEVRRLPLELSFDARLESCQLLNALLADTIVLYYLYKKHYWQLHGASFYELRLVLEKHATDQLALIDGLAQHVQYLGGVAVASPWQVVALSRIEHPPTGLESLPAALTRLIAAHELIVEAVQKAVVKAAQNGDSGTHALLSEDVLPAHKQQVRHLAEHMVETSPAHPTHRAIGIVIQPSKAEMEALLAHTAPYGVPEETSDQRHRRRVQSLGSLSNEMLARGDILPD